jgi:hypothetical protein
MTLERLFAPSLQYDVSCLWAHKVAAQSRGTVSHTQAVTLADIRASPGLERGEDRKKIAMISNGNFLACSLFFNLICLATSISRPYILLNMQQPFSGMLKEETPMSFIHRPGACLYIHVQKA